MEPEDEKSFDHDLIHAIFKHIWTKGSRESERKQGPDAADSEGGGTGASKKSRPASANVNALKLSSQLLRIFVTEAVERAAMIAEAEGSTKIEATHFERILPQLLLDF